MSRRILPERAAEALVAVGLKVDLGLEMGLEDSSSEDSELSDDDKSFRVRVGLSTGFGFEGTGSDKGC